MQAEAYTHESVKGRMFDSCINGTSSVIICHSGRAIDTRKCKREKGLQVRQRYFTKVQKGERFTAASTVLHESVKGRKVYSCVNGTSRKCKREKGLQLRQRYFITYCHAGRSRHTKIVKEKMFGSFGFSTERAYCFVIAWNEVTL